MRRKYAPVNDNFRMNVNRLPPENFKNVLILTWYSVPIKSIHWLRYLNIREIKICCPKESFDVQKFRSHNRIYSSCVLHVYYLVHLKLINSQLWERTKIILDLILLALKSKSPFSKCFNVKWIIFCIFWTLVGSSLLWWIGIIFFLPFDARTPKVK